VIGAVGLLGASGLLFGGLGVPVSADDVTAGGKPQASAAVQDGCVTAAAGTGEADGSVQPQGGGQLQAAGDGSASVSVCLEDLDAPPSGDPGETVPGDLDEVIPEVVDDVVPGDPSAALVGELEAAVTGALEGEVPGVGGGLPGDPGELPDGLDDVTPGDIGDLIPGDPAGPGDPGSALPGGLDDVVPGGVGGLVPDGSGIDPDGILDRVAQIIPDPIGNGGAPGGSGGGAPALNTSATGPGSGSVAVGRNGAEQGATTDGVLGTELERVAPSTVNTTLSPGATLPRTGGGLGHGVLRLLALLGVARAAFGLAKRPRPACH
jgi:hypothetical protein